MSTPLKKPTREQVVAWVKANPDASDDEIRAFAKGTTPPSPNRFKDTVKALGRGAAQGVTLGLADEITGAVEGVVRPGMSVAEGIPKQRGTDARLKEDAGGTFTVGEIGGAVGQGIGATKLLLSRGGALATLLNRAGSGGLAARAGATGLAGGAGAGGMAFGQAEGNPLERLDEAGVAGLIGGTLSAAMPVVGQVARAAGNAANIRPPFMNPVRESADVLNSALKRDNIAPDDVVNAAKGDPSVPQSLVDLAGDNTRAVATQAQARSNTARKTAAEMLEDRAEGERNRYVSRLQETLNPDDKDILKTAQELKDIRRAKAEANFPKALEGSVSDVEVAKFFREPEVRAAYNQFRENQLTLANAGKISMDEVPPEIYVYGTTKSGKKGVKLATVDIPMKAFHVIQQAVNDAIHGGLKNGKTIPKGRAKALQAALEKHMDTVEDLVPEYGAARRVYRDDSAAVDALEAGLGKPIKNARGRKIPDFKKSSAAEMAEWLVKKRASADAGDEVAVAEVENYMLGAYGALRDMLNKQKNPTGKLDLPAIKDKVRLLFAGDTDKADEFLRALKAEQKIKGTASVSKAGKAIQGEEEMVTPALDLMLIGAGTATGRPVTTLASIGRLLRGEHNMSEKTANATMDRLFKGVGGIEELIAGMESLKGARSAEVRRRARNVGVTAGVAAGATAGVSN